MKQTLQVRLSQHLALTPQLQQSIRLLQLSTLELHQEVEQMLEQNPLLEADEEELDASALPERIEPAANSAGAADEFGTGDDSAEESIGELQADDFGGTEREDWENGTEGDDFDGIRETPGTSVNSNGDKEDGAAQEQQSPGLSLQEHLRTQMAGMHLSPADRAALLYLIESLSDDGYLLDTLEELAENLCQDEPDALEETLAQLRCALNWLQSLEPAGIGARNLSECLLLQLREHPSSQIKQIAALICEKHLDALARHDHKKLMSLTGASEALLRQAQGLIASLEPRPGRAFSYAEAAAIQPDVLVLPAGRGWKVVLNPDVMPKLRVNDLYARVLRQQRGGISGSTLGSHLQEARWFIKNIQQRFDTILRVSKAIVERQKAFFTHGELAMKPLVLREIADELGLHESTISRVTTAKYMATRFGIFELKYFFGSSLNTEAGGNASSTAVRALIKQFIAAESPAKPLSDSQLSSMLEEQGIQVARRTVAKYREGLKIAPANLRKQL
jgi:RNA polymerase sigma-54 factor